MGGRFEVRIRPIAIERTWSSRVESTSSADVRCDSIPLGGNRQYDGRSFSAVAVLDSDL
jgi:hypothetical protein